MPRLFGYPFYLREDDDNFHIGGHNENWAVEQVDCLMVLMNLPPPARADDPSAIKVAGDKAFKLNDPSCSPRRKKGRIGARNCQPLSITRKWRGGRWGRIGAVAARRAGVRYAVPIV
jgi:hypothetical protein